MNVVPTPATRRLANYAVSHARAAESGADAAIRWLPEVAPDQVAAFVGLVLARAVALDTAPPSPELKPPGRPRKPSQFTDAERTALSNAYRRGIYTEQTLAAYRESGRLRRRNSDARKKAPNVTQVKPGIASAHRENGPDCGTMGTARTGAETPAGPDHLSFLRNERG